MAIGGLKVLMSGKNITTLVSDSYSLRSGTAYNTGGILFPGTLATALNQNPLFSTLSYTTLACSCWIKKTDTTASEFRMFQTGDGLGGVMFGFNASNDGSGTKLYATFNWTGVGSTQVRSTSNISNDVWHHLYLKVDTTQAVEANRVIMYIDGAEAAYAFTSGSLEPSLNDTLKGKNSPYVAWQDQQITRYYNSTHTPKHFIYQNAVFSGTLPAIGALYNAGSPKSITGMAGLFSHLDAALPLVAGVGYTGLDPVLGVNWSSTVMETSTDIPV